MRTDAELKADVMDRLDSIPGINAHDIEVFVEAGLVTLNGRVDTHQTRFQVERAARRVAGVRGLQMQIRPGHADSKRGSRS